MDFQIFLEKLATWGLEFFSRYYGNYPGIVTRNDDPSGAGRIQASVPSVGLKYPVDVWIEPASPLSGPGRGFFCPPEVGDGVWVWFRNGNGRHPHGYLGGWYANGELAEDFHYTESNSAPERRGFAFRKGHRLVFNEEKEKETVRLVWHQEDPDSEVHTDPQAVADLGSGSTAYLGWDENGTAQLTNKDGAILELNAQAGNILLQQKDGNWMNVTSDGFVFSTAKGSFVSFEGKKATMAFNDGITLMGKAVSLQAAAVHLTGNLAVKSAVVGEDLVAWLATVTTWMTALQVWIAAHVHPTTAPGAPTTPAVPPPPPAPAPAPPNILSQKVKLS